MLADGMSDKGGWSKAQFSILGVTWPPLRGWKDVAIGKPITEEAAKLFVSLKNKHKATKTKPTNSKLMAAAPLLLEASMVCHAWHRSESQSLGTFNERMELCNYSEWLTRKALSAALGEPFDEPYEGIPHLLLTPGLGVHLHRATAEDAAEIAREI